VLAEQTSNCLPLSLSFYPSRSRRRQVKLAERARGWRSQLRNNAHRLSADWPASQLTDRPTRFELNPSSPKIKPLAADPRALAESQLVIRILSSPSSALCMPVARSPRAQTATGETLHFPQGRRCCLTLGSARLVLRFSWLK